MSNKIATPRSALVVSLLTIVVLSVSTAIVLASNVMYLRSWEIQDQYLEWELGLHLLLPFPLLLIFIPLYMSCVWMMYIFYDSLMRARTNEARLHQILKRHDIRDLDIPDVSWRFEMGDDANRQATRGNGAPTTTPRSGGRVLPFPPPPESKDKDPDPVA